MDFLMEIISLKAFPSILLTFSFFIMLLLVFSVLCDLRGRITKIEKHLLDKEDTQRKQK